MDEARGDSGTLSHDDFAAILSDFFGTKDAESVSMLIKAAEKELNVEEGAGINYKSLIAQVSLIFTTFTVSPHSKGPLSQKTSF